MQFTLRNLSLFFFSRVKRQSPPILVGLLIARVTFGMKGRLGRPCFDSISTWRGIERIPVCSLSPACKTGPLIWARVTIFTGVRRLVRSLSLFLLSSLSRPPRQLVFQRGSARARACGLPFPFPFLRFFRSTVLRCPSDGAGILPSEPPNSRQRVHDRKYRCAVGLHFLGNH